MSFADTIRALSLCVQARIPVLMEGGVGDGKTAINESILQRMCDDYQVSIVALHQPTEYGGFPVPQAAVQNPEGKILQPAGVRMLALGWVARLARASHPGLFLDEFSNGAPATRAATMRGVLDGVWGETKIPNLSVVAAMNSPEISESGYELSAPLSNRFCHIPWDMPVEYWTDQLIAGFPAPPLGGKLPAGWEAEHSPWARTLVAAFAHVRASDIKLPHGAPESAAERAKPFPSPRTWTMAVRGLAACRALGYGIGDGAGIAPHEVVTKILSGCVGSGAAISFLAYASALDLPDPEEVLKAPTSLVMPERGDRAFAVLTGVISAVMANLTTPRWYAAWDVLEQAAKQGRVDIGAGAARVLTRARPADATTLPRAVQAYLPVLKAAGFLNY